MRKLNILLIPPHDLLRHPLPNRLYHLGRNLACRHNVFLLTYPGHPLANRESKRVMNCRKVTFTPIRVGSVALYYVLNALNIYLALYHLVRRTRIDVVIHANILPSYIAVRMAKRYGIPTIYDYHDHFAESAASYYSNSYLRGFAARVASSLVKRSIRMSDYVVTVSHTYRDLVRNILKSDGERISVIPNGFEPGLFEPIPMNEARKTLGIEQSAYVLLYYGSIDVWVDLDALMRLVKGLVPRYEGLLLVVVGMSHSTASRMRLQRLIEDYGLQKNVMLISPQPYEKIPIFVCASNVVVAPYKNVLKNYVVPLKMVESLACWRPVITRKIEEFRRWFGQMPVFYYETEEELKEAVVGLIESRHDLQADFRRLSGELRDQLSWQRLAIQYEGILEKLR